MKVFEFTVKLKDSTVADFVNGSQSKKNVIRSQVAKIQVLGHPIT